MTQQITHAPHRPENYRDRLTESLPEFRELLSIMWHTTFPPDLRDAGRIPVAAGSVPAVTGESAVTWVGHATFVLRIGGRTILTDPVWSRRLPGVRARLTAPGVAWEDLPEID